MTERDRFLFTAKEYESGQPWICLVAWEQGLEVLGQGFLGLDLPKGTTLNRAKEIAKFLEDNIIAVSYSRP